MGLTQKSSRSSFLVGLVRANPVENAGQTSTTITRGRRNKQRIAVDGRVRQRNNDNNIYRPNAVRVSVTFSYGRRRRRRDHRRWLTDTVPGDRRRRWRRAIIIIIIPVAFVTFARSRTSKVTNRKEALPASPSRRYNIIIVIIIVTTVIRRLPRRRCV